MKYHGPSRQWIAANSPILLITALALALRLYRLPEQSLWFDEYLSLCNLSAPDAVTHHALLRIHFPAQALWPLYSFFQYFYVQIAGASVLSLRLMSVAIGVASVPLLYALVRSVYGRFPGLVSALCLAVSVQHIWFSQEIRAYEVVTFLALVSTLALQRALERGNWGYWLLHFGVNALLPWTHTFAVFLLPAQGILVLLVNGRSLRPSIRWGLINMLLLLPYVVWIRSMPHLNSDAPSLGMDYVQILRTIFCGDLIEDNTALLPPWKTAPGADSAIPGLLLWKPLFNRGLLVFFALSIIAALLHTVLRRRIDSRVTGQAQSEWDRRRWTCFFTLLAVLPAATLGLAEMVTGLVLMTPQYVMYNTIGLYALIGAGLAALPGRWVRGLAVGILMLLYGGQLGLFLPETTRTDWRAATRYVEQHAAPGDLVVDLQLCAYSGRYFQYYAKRDDLTIHTANTLHGACELTADFFRKEDEAGRSAGKRRRAWWLWEQYPLLWNYPVILLPDYSIDTARKKAVSVVQAAVAACGWTDEMREFKGHWNIVACEISPPDGAAVLPMPADLPWFVDRDVDQIIDLSGLTFPDDAARTAAKEALLSSIPVWPPPFAYARVYHVINLIEAGHYDLAEAVARLAVRDIPNFALAHFALGLTLVLRNKSEAMDELNRALVFDWSLRRVYARLVAALNAPEGGALDREVARLETMGFHFLMPVFKAVIGHLAGQDGVNSGES